MRKKLLGSASALSLAGALAVTATPAYAAVPQAASRRVTSTSAPAVKPLQASGWIPVYLHAFYGNGCADYLVDQRLEPIVSEPCADSNHWYYRNLNYVAGSPIYDGDELEFVDSGLQYALGYSGGELKLETPNVNTTFLRVQSAVEVDNTWYEELVTPQDESDQISPSGAGDDLTLASEFASGAQDAWLECAVPTLGIGPCNNGSPNQYGVVSWPLTP
jgi:hypothetical protein